MNKKNCRLVKQLYEKGDSTELFQTILSIADEIGLDSALECLEQCVIEKRLAWLDKNLATLEKTGDPLLDGYRAFYEIYLGVSPPNDGDFTIVSQQGSYVDFLRCNRQSNRVSQF